MDVFPMRKIKNKLTFIFILIYQKNQYQLFIHRIFKVYLLLFFLQIVTNPYNILLCAIRFLQSTTKLKAVATCTVFNLCENFRISIYCKCFQMNISPKIFTQNENITYSHNFQLLSRQTQTMLLLQPNIKILAQVDLLDIGAYAKPKV